MATLPAQFKIAEAQITNNLNITETDSRSLIRIQRKTGGQRWELRLTSTRVNLEDIKPITAYIGAIRNTMSTVDVVLPVYSESTAPNGATTATIAIGETQAAVNNTSAMQVGDYFTFSGHSKVYVVTEIVDGTTIKFYPNAVAAVGVAETITFDGVVFTCRLDGEPIAFTASNDNTATIELDLVEAL